MTGPRPLRVAWSVLRARRVRRPRPRGTAAVAHPELTEILERARQDGPEVLPDLRPLLRDYRDRLAAADPDLLEPNHALAYWVNLYNAGALLAAGDAVAAGVPSVLRIPGAFHRPFVTVAGEGLSLDDVEHGKLRRLGDPRIHGALVCGSVSCPTLRPEPYLGPRVGDQLDDQLRRFLAAGGAVVDRTGGAVHLSRVFLWYGADFVRPHRMPTVLPARPEAVLRAVSRWMTTGDAEWIRTARPKVRFDSYDWGLSCSVG